MKKRLLNNRRKKKPLKYLGGIRMIVGRKAAQRAVAALGLRHASSSETMRITVVVGMHSNHSRRRTRTDAAAGAGICLHMAA
jgi:hypothetical protein